MNRDDAQKAERRWEAIIGSHGVNIHNVPQRLAHVPKDPWDGYEAARATITDAMLGKL